MTTCNCVNPSPNCPCHRQVVPLTVGPPLTPPYPYWWWIAPQPWQPTITVTTKTNFVYEPKPDIPALRPEDV